MNSRVAIWACVGFLVAGWWGLYFANADKGNPIEPVVLTLAYLSQPIAALAASNLHIPISLYWVLALNAATYALLGFVVERLRCSSSHRFSGSWTHREN